jgi:hypothetical protein
MLIPTTSSRCGSRNPGPILRRNNGATRRCLPLQFGNDIPSVTTDDFNKQAQYGTTISNPRLPGSKPVASCKDATLLTDPGESQAATASVNNGSNDGDRRAQSVNGNRGAGDESSPLATIKSRGSSRTRPLRIARAGRSRR